MISKLRGLKCKFWMQNDYCTLEFATSEGIVTVNDPGNILFVDGVSMSAISLSLIKKYIKKFGVDGIKEPNLTKTEIKDLIDKLRDDSDFSKVENDIIEMAIRLYKEKARPDTYYYFYTNFCEPSEWIMFDNEAEMYENWFSSFSIEGYCERWEDMDEGTLEMIYEEMEKFL